MGFAVDGQCYESMIQAQDAFFGGSKPIITADGQPMMFKRESDGWYLNGEKVETGFPICSPEQNFQDGLSAGYMVLAVVLTLVVIGRIGGMLK
ncbi:hypothetical protein J2T38_002300 [Neisseria perflava]|uniref:hypothetical protein n=1 Tax=Neisseria perflava TaxID=33053 RepID=UPI00209DF3AD|nr:hypothetical protein [Neisseria perflava]MCP1773446.1 hypothetical protein [Neisseria perflava]